MKILILAVIMVVLIAVLVVSFMRDCKKKAASQEPTAEQAAMDA